jgi:arylesterase/paraoxonase
VIWVKRIGWVLGSLILVLLLFTLEFMHFGGQFNALPAAAPGPCSRISLTASAEDIQIDRGRGVAYLSALDRRGLVEGLNVQGDVLQLDLNDERATPVSALAARPADFRPHGMSLYRMGDGMQRLFVISHPAGGGHSIEIFEQVAGGSFRPVVSIRDPLLLSPNAIVAVGPEQFYVANDKGATNGLQRASEFGLRRGMSKLVYFDGKNMRVVADGLKSAVGLGISPDGLRLYAAETLGKRLAVYRRNAGTGELAFDTHVSMAGSPDNINVDTEGEVWVAVHARLLDLVRNFGDAAHASPTQIVRYVDAGKPPLRTVYAQDGREISAGSVGAVFNGTLLIGSITDRAVLRCRLP